MNLNDSYNKIYDTKIEMSKVGIIYKRTKRFTDYFT